MKKVRIIDQNHGLTPLENFRFFGHVRYILLFSSKASLYLEHPQTSFVGLFLIKTNNEESLNF